MIRTDINSNDIIDKNSNDIFRTTIFRKKDKYKLNLLCFIYLFKVRIKGQIKRWQS